MTHLSEVLHREIAPREAARIDPGDDSGEIILVGVVRSGRQTKAETHNIPVDAGHGGVGSIVALREGSIDRVRREGVPIISGHVYMYMSSGVSAPAGVDIVMGHKMNVNIVPVGIIVGIQIRLNQMKFLVEGLKDAVVEGLCPGHGISSRPVTGGAVEIAESHFRFHHQDTLDILTGLYDTRGLIITHLIKQQVGIGVTLHRLIEAAVCGLKNIFEGVVKIELVREILGGVVNAEVNSKTSPGEKFIENLVRLVSRLRRIVQPADEFPKLSQSG